jgi:carboxymethylenebutenolidase
MPRGRALTLKSAADGFEFGAYHVAPEDARHGGLVLIQEIFGVTDHIRGLCDGFAGEGYEVIAPSFFDRQEKGFEAAYDADGVAKGRRYSEAAPWDLVAGDLQAAVGALAGPVFAVGFCWGGTAAWLAASRCEGLAAASCYYGRRIPELLAETPRCPTILHFGRRDPTIPMSVVDEIAAAHEDLSIYRYDAGHGFASDRGADYDPDSARLAHLRTLQIFQRSSGVRSEV